MVLEIDFKFIFISNNTIFVTFIKMDKKKIVVNKLPNFKIIKPIIQAFWNIHHLVDGPLRDAYIHLVDVWRTAINMGGTL